MRNSIGLRMKTNADLRSFDCGGMLSSASSYALYNKFKVAKPEPSIKHQLDKLKISIEQVINSKGNLVPNLDEYFKAKDHQFFHSKNNTLFVDKLIGEENTVQFNHKYLTHLSSSDYNRHGRNHSAQTQIV